MQRAEPAETARRAHFQMHVPYLMLWHRLTRVSNIVTTFLGQKSIIALLQLLRMQIRQCTYKSVLSNNHMVIVDGTEEILVSFDEKQ